MEVSARSEKLIEVGYVVEGRVAAIDGCVTPATPPARISFVEVCRERVQESKLVLAI